MNKNFKIILAVCTAIGACLISFAVYANGCEPFAVDIAVRDFFFSMRNSVLNVLVPALTHCGDTVTIVALCAILVILPTRKKYGFPVTLAALTGLAIYKPMKHIFLRARPDVMFHLVEQGGYSFPSGHSTSSVIVYGLLFYLIQKHCKNETLKKVLSAICLVFALLIGPSRLYVGVHWFTDVAAGMLFGLTVVAIYICILERIYDKNERLR